jgi:hypothetical protein
MNPRHLLHHSEWMALLFLHTGVHLGLSGQYVSRADSLREGRQSTVPTAIIYSSTAYAHQNQKNMLLSFVSLRKESQCLVLEE